MSGTGQSDFRAPTSLTTVSGDQPVVNRDGTPTMQFYNFLQRLASLVGQPTGNNPPGQTIGVANSVISRQRCRSRCSARASTREVRRTFSS